MTKYGFSISNNKNRSVEIVFSPEDVEGYIHFNFSKSCPDLVKRATIEKRIDVNENKIIYSLPYSDLTFTVTPCKLIYVRRI